MCTNIATKTRVAGSAKTASGWTSGKALLARLAEVITEAEASGVA
jgi:hypothetical protein